MELAAGKVAVVTGAASGIGLALAGRFASGDRRGDSSAPPARSR
jgi:NAD(P)-dependent dehydrogenase (short-subunit alcohol dehydrogenase family)